MSLLHRLYAWAFGYFWLPCPVCGRMFGGHQIGSVSLFPNGRQNVGKCVCNSRACAILADQMNWDAERRAHSGTSFAHIPYTRDEGGRK